MKLKPFLFLSAVCLSFHIFADGPQKVLPQFAGFWYDNTTSMSSTTCSLRSYSYNIQGSLTDVESALYNQLPKENCTWQKPSITSTGGVMPPDFPGDENDFNTLKGSIQEYSWMSYCENSNGGIVDAKANFIFPSYACPANTTFAYVGENYGCYPSTKTTCGADVLGRDLDTNIPMLKSAGHVGLSLGGAMCASDQAECNDPDTSPLTSAVAEVLTSVDPRRQSVVHIDSVPSFVNAVPNFWGDKYDLPGHQVTYNDFGNILLAMSSQYDLPSEYTYFWGYEPAGFYSAYTFDPSSGNIIQVLNIFPGKFRCDSFVYYCYQQAGLTIPYAGIRTPYSLYSAFVNQRAVNGVFSAGPSLQSKIPTVSDSSLEQQIEEVFAAQDFNLGQADDLTNQYDADTTISRQEKINFLWGLATSYQSDSFKFNYLLDVLGYLQPYELANNLIDLYGSNQDQDVKNTLITVLSFTAYFPTEQAAQALSPQDVQNEIAIINFLKSLALTEPNPQLASSALLNVLPILNDDQAAELLNQFVQARPKALSDQTYVQQQISIALANKQNQAEAIEQLVNQGSPALALAACQIMPMYPQSNLVPASVETLSNLLTKNQSALLNQSPYILNLSGCYWPSAYAGLQTSNPDQRLQIIKSMVLTEGNLQIAVDLINSIKPSDLQAMTKADLLDIKEHVTTLESAQNRVLNQQSASNLEINQKLTYLNSVITAK